MNKMLATAAGLALAAGALANPALSLAPGATNPGSFGERAPTNAIVNFDVTGIESWDAPGSPNNVVVNLDLAAALGYASGTSITMTSVGWDVTLTSFGASWLSEIGVAFGPSGGPAAINLRPGAGSNAPGTSTPFSSGGQVQFDSIPLPDIVLADGVLRMEFFESFDDIAGSVDGIWESGFLSIGTFEAVVPAPGAAAVLGLAGLAGLRRRR